jgi:hypothetical protein
VFDATQIDQGLNSSAHSQNSPLNSKIFHKGVGSHKERLGRAHEAIERLFKWSETSNPWEREVECLLEEYEKLVIGSVRANQLDRRVTPNWLRTLSELANLG